MMRKDGNKNFGIQKWYFKHTLALLILALLLSGIGIWSFVKQNISNAIIDKYEFMDEKMGMELDALFQRSDEVTADCIIRDDVQESLLFQPLEDSEQKALSKYFAYVDLDEIGEYFYIDNKQNIYTRSYSSVTYEEFVKSGFEELLGDEYAKTKWIWTKDTLFGTDKEALFIGRYVRSMDYAHEPGMLYFKMEEDFLDKILGMQRNERQEIFAGILDSEGNLCSSWFEENYELGEKEKANISQIIQKSAGESGMVVRGEQITGGVLSAYRQAETGFTVFTIVPDEVLSKSMTGFVVIIVAIYLVVFAAAFILSIYVSKRLTTPIRKISDTMTQFRGNDFSKIEQLHTNTELDYIGDSYNEMLGNIERLLNEIKEQEKALRESEMNVLISQINPHFLYNTLDTIYMLARINNEDTTMKMIHALSRYLKVTLSKGSNMISLEDEIDNVKSYMQIQQIRNQNLFDYEIDCQVNPKMKILKLILQPLVENSIKYGFCEIFEGGFIRISIREEQEELVARVYNNGKPVDLEIMEKINAANGKDVADIKKMFDGTSHGYGVINVLTRLRLRYGSDVRLLYSAKSDGTECIIRIPRGELQNEME